MIETTLHETLEKHGIKANELAVEAKVRPATVYSLRNGKAKSVTFNTLTILLDTLVEMTGEDLGVEDVFTYKKPDKLKKAES